MRTLLLCGAVGYVLIIGATPAMAADTYQAAGGKSGMSSANTSPLYEASGSKGENPLFEGPLFEEKSDLRQAPKERSKHSSDASAGKGAEKAAPAASPTNPLYDESGHAAQNPLHESK